MKNFKFLLCSKNFKIFDVSIEDVDLYILVIGILYDE